MNKPTTLLRDQPDPIWWSILACILFAKSPFLPLINLSTASSLYTDSGIVCACIVFSVSSSSLGLTIVHSTPTTTFKFCFSLILSAAILTSLDTPSFHAASNVVCIFLNFNSNVGSSLFAFFILTVWLVISRCCIV